MNETTPDNITPAPLDPSDPQDAQLMAILAVTPRENYPDLLHAMQRLHAGDHPFNVACQLWIALGWGDRNVSELAHLVAPESGWPLAALQPPNPPEAAP